MLHIIVLNLAPTCTSDVSPILIKVWGRMLNVSLSSVSNKQHGSFIMSLRGARDVPANAGFLWDRAAVIGDRVKGTLCDIPAHQIFKWRKVSLRKIQTKISVPSGVDQALRFHIHNRVRYILHFNQRDNVRINVRLRRVCVTTVAVDKYCIFCVCVCVSVLYWHLWPV
jgi:hypothetical protein